MKPEAFRRLRRDFESPAQREARIKQHYFNEWLLGRMTWIQAEARAQGDIRGDNRFRGAGRDKETK